ncbi:Voltage-gated potassium channel subunit beta-2,Voltage-gated potassium channel subunit beta-3,Voltage-gated potassium channel subunit beta-1 [Lepeophtheirus salmonis]|uniref:Voltage-gated potassium channel subunit beta-2,Voltage-gated potassium channel subunit beta-3,Voltage-gated potassium channel subunit beta-1 n=1 Tax=Lepeophtheirus salmonis TaxID=72036 RepID=A0A7R8CHD4_LEPSM|nr:Voltage-gated potassium channel subunit beta-2,Voltage-gated potassium channel subunit beta-3,Voltage-gated potassium channel subunit beta-1 [Lepeophtheirus salmonis]CAF2818065.1 Voltage-gated potassium channel subunit beta-2,Voltage-gated potassium channel subunit beta-3,Voltage-gated potassium channel subunit beta-1 [Lepeophtheirus salmonis]
MIVHKSDSNCPIDEIIRAFAYLINDGKIMYWGTARWSPVEIFETYSQCRHLGLIPPICELGEYHWFHREKVELYMAELYNKIGIGLMTWSPISFGLCLGKNDDPLDLLPKLNYADKLGCTLSQLQVAWSVRNQTCQCVIISASDSNELDELIGSLKIISKLSPQSMEEIDKILCNKTYKTSYDINIAAKMGYDTIPNEYFPSRAWLWNPGNGNLRIRLVMTWRKTLITWTPGHLESVQLNNKYS